MTTCDSLDRVLYTGAAAEKIVQLIGHASSPLTVNDRISLVLDAAAFAKAGLAEVSSALSLLEHFTSETDGE